MQENGHPPRWLPSPSHLRGTLLATMSGAPASGKAPQGVQGRPPHCGLLSKAQICCC